MSRVETESWRELRGDRERRVAGVGTHVEGDALAISEGAYADLCVRMDNSGRCRDSASRSCAITELTESYRCRAGMVVRSSCAICQWACPSAPRPRGAVSARR